MVNFTLKNIPKELHKRLKQKAEQNRRSLNQEIIELLEKNVSVPDIQAMEVLNKAKEIHNLFPGMVSHKEIQAYKVKGRL